MNVTKDVTWGLKLKAAFFGFENRTNRLAEGDDVVIESGWNMYLDIEETPILNILEINGRLTFLSSNFSITLNAQKIYVRAGELLIGSEEEPFPETANIVLHGDMDSATLTLSPTLEVYNKVLVNVGRMAFYGKPRTQVLTRLRQEAFEGDSEIYVEAGLDLVEGDELFLAPTSFLHTAIDYATVVSYNSDSGLVTIDRNLGHYHYGADSIGDF